MTNPAEKGFILNTTDLMADDKHYQFTKTCLTTESQHNSGHFGKTVPTIRHSDLQTYHLLATKTTDLDQHIKSHFNDMPDLVPMHTHATM